MEVHLKIASMLVDLLYNKFTFLNFKFGLYALIEIIPGIDNIFSLFLSAYLLWIAKQMHVPQSKINRMIMNSILDLSIGTVPIVGDFVDIAFRAHARNLRIVQSYIKQN